MSDARVALVASAGPARERLQAALDEVGAQLVLVADPADVQAARVADAGVDAVVVALDPAAEEALDRLGPVLDDPAIVLILEEADQIVRREGWDAARWVRHLATKLGLSDSVLPPAASAAEAVPTLDSATDDAGATGEEIDAPADAAEAVEPGLDESAESEPTESEATLQQAQASAIDWESTALEWSSSIGNEVPVDDGDDAPADGAVSIDAPARDAGDAPAASPLSLSDEDPTADALRGDDAQARGRFERDLDALHQRISGMALEDHVIASDRTQGWVLLLAGTGGPDAVRQLLGGLPPDFPRAVLVRQLLPGQAAYDKLVRQMQRITQLPVELAQLDGVPEPGHVYVLPVGIVLGRGDQGAVFQPGDDDIAGLPSTDSAIVALSGTDPAIADAALAQSWNGALVLAQVLDGCYAPAASQALTARGVEAAAPAAIARQLAARWPA